LLAFVAAERREFDGVLANTERFRKLDWPLSFARMAWLNERAVLLVANGPGPGLAGQAVDVARKYEELDGLVSTGFCGALDPALQPCDIFVATVLLTREREGASCSRVTTKSSHQSGKLLSIDHVVCTSAEKTELYKTGAAAVEMEAAAVAARAREWDVPFYAVRVVTDTAQESFPLDFNRMRDSEGRFNRGKILGAALHKPRTVLPALFKLNRRCKSASEALGDFIARSQF
jgi:adenosylhomocysteine nucleosidase